MVPPQSTLDRLSSALEGRYAIVREIGAGGMATVYLAEDVRHRRKVAIKVLHPELTAVLGPERFLNEIELTANLQHPHILPLFDSGAADNLLFYVMPFVEGETLRQKLMREQQLPIAEAIRIATDVASALEYAHKRGVVHRDIKPENVLLHDGRPLVADFGIALAVQQAGGARMTQTGMSLGTPQYMAPEQAMGDKSVDHRADIYAIGAVTYEMLTGEPPFTGPNAQAVVAKILTTDPSSLMSKRRSVPPHVDAAVLTALEKMPADRFASAAQFAAALDNPESIALAARRRHPAHAPAGAAKPWRSSALLVPVLALLLLVATGAAMWGWMRPRSEAASPVVRFRISIDDAGYADAGGRMIVMSAAGDYFVYAGRNERGEDHLYRRNIDALESAVIPGTRGASSPFLSPNGRWLGYSIDRKIRKMALAGGPALTVASVDSGFLGATWGPDDVIVVATSAGLRQVPAAGGRLTVVTAADTAKKELHRFPEFLPDGRAVLFQIRDSTGIDHLAAVDLKRGSVKRLGQVGGDPRYVEPGYVLLANSTGTIVAVPFDASNLEVTGEPIPVLEGVAVGSGGAARLGVSRRGSLVYSTGVSGVRSIVAVDRKGAVQAMSPEMRQYWSPRYSPDGRRIALEVTEGAVNSIWIFDVTQKSLTRLTFSGMARRPFWTPDGSRVTYSLQQAGTDQSIASIRADGGGRPEQLLKYSANIWGDDWSLDGRTLVFHERIPAGNNEIMLMSRDSGSKPVPYLTSPAHEGAAAVSPDGRWLAYFSDESGRTEVYVRAFPAPGGRVQVSVAGGSEPRWSRDGRELFYRNGDKMMVATVRLQPEFTVLDRAELFRGQFPMVPFFAQYDVAPDGGHFVMLQSPASSEDLIVVLNWFDQLRGRGSRARAARAAAQ